MAKAQDNCDPKDKWPLRNDCDVKNIRARRGALGTVFRAANAGVQALFRRGLPVAINLRNYSAGFQILFRRGVIPASSIRPEFHCTPRPEYVLTPVYNEHRDFVYNEDGVLVFCEIRIV
jgi:hypothetical protein